MLDIVTVSSYKSRYQEQSPSCGKPIGYCCAEVVGSGDLVLKEYLEQTFLGSEKTLARYLLEDLAFVDYLIVDRVLRHSSIILQLFAGLGDFNEQVNRLVESLVGYGDLCEQELTLNGSRNTTGAIGLTLEDDVAQLITHPYSDSDIVDNAYSYYSREGSENRKSILRDVILNNSRRKCVMMADFLRD